MALSNAEKQRRYINKLKAEAAIGRQFLAQMSTTEVSKDRDEAVTSPDTNDKSV